MWGIWVGRGGQPSASPRDVVPEDPLDRPGKPYLVSPRPGAGRWPSLPLPRTKSPCVPGPLLLVPQSWASCHGHRGRFSASGMYIAAQSAMGATVTSVAHLYWAAAGLFCCAVPLSALWYWSFLLCCPFLLACLHVWQRGVRRGLGQVGVARAPSLCPPGRRCWEAHPRGRRSCYKPTFRLVGAAGLAGAPGVRRAPSVGLVGWYDSPSSY